MISICETPKKLSKQKYVYRFCIEAKDGSEGESFSSIFKLLKFCFENKPIISEYNFTYKKIIK